MTEDSKKIADTYGYEHQSRQLIEEMAELTQAINKYWRAGEKITIDGLIEEIADVEICLEQVKYLLNIPKSIISDWKEYKIKRELDRIGGVEE